MSLRKISTGKSSEKGFSLMELIVSLVIFLVAVGAIYSIAQLANIQRNTVSTRTDQLRSARIALEYIRRDALNAGFGYHRTGGNVRDNMGTSLFNLASDTDSQRDLLTGIIAGNDLNINNLNFGARMDAVAFVSRDLTFNNGAVLNYQSSAANGTSIDITTAANGTANCRQYDLYLFEAGTGLTQIIGLATAIPSTNTIRLAVGTVDPLGVNQSATDSGDAQSLFMTSPGGGTMKKINLYSYSVTTEGVLVRKRFGNRTGLTAAEQIETRELVYGVSDFQIKYFMEDGTTIDDPSGGNNGRTNQIKMNNVVQIQISITIVKDPNDASPQTSTPITIKEYISAKNLRYEAS